MTEKEKIRAEVERLRALTADPISNPFDLVLHFIDSLPEEKVSEDLNEAAIKYCNEIEERNHSTLLGIEKGFIRGAQWKEQQMISTAVEAEITDIRTYKHENEVDFTLMLEKGIVPYEIGEEVKLLIVKEDEK